MTVEPRMTIRHRRPGAAARRLSAGVLAVLAVTLSACATSGPPQQPATSLPGSASPTDAPSPTALPSLPTVSSLPLPGTTIGSGTTTTLHGTVTEGVESGCVVLVDSSGAVSANLQGWDLGAHPFDTKVEVTGAFEPDMMTTCQQGTPFEVTAVVRAADAVPSPVSRRRSVVTGQPSPTRGDAATAVPSASSLIRKSANTLGARSCSSRSTATARERISGSAASVARIPMKCRQAR